MKKTKQTDPNFVSPDDRSAVEIVHPNYQPSKAELEDDLRLDATFEEAVEALTRPVHVKYIKRLKSRS